MEKFRSLNNIIPNQWKSKQYFSVVSSVYFLGKLLKQYTKNENIFPKETESKVIIELSRSL